MITFNQFEEFNQEMRSRISRVLSSSKESLEELQGDFFNYNEHTEVLYSVEGDEMCITYTYLDEEEGFLIERVQVPRLFVDDFEEFMRQA